MGPFQRPHSGWASAKPEPLSVEWAVTKARGAPKEVPGPSWQPEGSKGKRAPGPSQDTAFPSSPMPWAFKGSTGSALVAISHLAAWLLGTPLEPVPVLTQKLQG